MILDLLFPRLCIACKQFSLKKHLLCEMCVELVDPLGWEGRCRRCFQKKKGKRCSGCIGEVFLKKVALFQRGDPIEALWREEERFSKTIASLFVLQMERLQIPLPEAIYFPKDLTYVGKKLMRLLSLPFASKESSILCISRRYEESDFPIHLYFSKIFFIAFTIND